MSKEKFVTDLGLLLFFESLLLHFDTSATYRIIFGKVGKPTEYSMVSGYYDLKHQLENVKVEGQRINIVVYALKSVAPDNLPATIVIMDIIDGV